MGRPRFLVVGDLEPTRLVCTLLTDRGHDVVHLTTADEASLRTALAEPVEGVAVVVRGDLLALRLTLLVESLQPGVPVVVTIFDRTLGRHLAQTVPHCVVTSPADVAAPALAAACARPDALAVVLGPDRVDELVDDDDGPRLRRTALRPTGIRARLGRLVPRPYGGSEGLLLLGLGGLALALGMEWLLGVAVLHEGIAQAFYSSARLVATVGPAGAAEHGAPVWYLVVSGLLMLAGIALTGATVAGLVEWIVGPRGAALVGRRRVPRQDHVVVAGLGQVGLRLAQLLRQLDVPVVVVERLATTPNLDVARQSRIPVVIGDAGSRAVLNRVGVRRARAVAAMGSDELENISVVINASAVAPDVRLVLRAGEGTAVEETTSLFRIADVGDVATMTAAWVASALAGRPPRVVWTRAHRVGMSTGTHHEDLPVPVRCHCPDSRRSR